MSLNIKNEEADRLARELADLTGESVTAAVTEALRERLERERRQRRREGLSERLLAIGAEIASRLKEPWKSIDIDELLYDEKTGLPK
jgi:antitoxin VapB